jgi:hypothetical protein
MFNQAEMLPRGCCVGRAPSPAAFDFAFAFDFCF